jgi:hypothetical protein
MRCWREPALLTRPVRPGRDPAARGGRQALPDDAEAWYQLGDAKYHLPNALVDWEEIEPAFARAVSLAPRMTAYRLHLVEGVFRQHADSAMMAEQVAELERIAPNSRQARRYRVAQLLTQGAARRTVPSSR